MRSKLTNVFDRLKKRTCSGGICRYDPCILTPLQVVQCFNELELNDVKEIKIKYYWEIYKHYRNLEQTITFEPEIWVDTITKLINSLQRNHIKPENTEDKNTDEQNIEYEDTEGERIDIWITFIELKLK